MQSDRFGTIDASISAPHRAGSREFPHNYSLILNNLIIIVMKKTFFTLLALSGAAMASEPIQQDYSSSITLDYGWMLEFEITANTLDTGITHVFFKAQGGGMVVQAPM